MSRARLALLLWIALLLAPGLAAGGDEERDGAAAQPAPSPPTPRTVVHRRGAGEPGEDGWVAARDERGQFAVELPGRFADYTQTGVAAERSITIHGLVHVRPGAFGTVQRFRATCTLYLDGPPPEAEELFEQAIGDQERRGWVKERRRVEIDGQPGLRYLVEDERSSIRGQLYRLPDRMCVLIVESQLVSRVSRADSERFFDSFELAE
ncbi:MAG: hypothetical protein QNK03_07315 [Myxococcota bacterium]|nr:hypothetical protein [Myxococcota bacterium]